MSITKWKHIHMQSGKNRTNKNIKLHFVPGKRKIRDQNFSLCLELEERKGKGRKIMIFPLPLFGFKYLEEGKDLKGRN